MSALCLVFTQSDLSLRRNFYLAINGVDVDDISYYIENFSDIDRNIIDLTMDILYELDELKIITMIRMMPSQDFNLQT